MSFYAVFGNPLGEGLSAPLVGDRLPELGVHGKRVALAIRKAFVAWYKREFGRPPTTADATIYSPEGWRKRGEPYHEHALVIFTFEGTAAEFFNEGHAQKTLEPRGYYLEWGHHWNAGAYPTD